MRQKGSGFPKSVVFIRKYQHCRGEEEMAIEQVSLNNCVLGIGKLANK